MKDDLNNLDRKLVDKKSTSTSKSAFQKFNLKEKKANFGYNTGISNTTTLAGTREIKREEIGGVGGIGGDNTYNKANNGRNDRNDLNQLNQLNQLNHTFSNTQSFKNENEESAYNPYNNNNQVNDDLRKVKTLQQPLDSWNLDLFSEEKKKNKPKGSFADRFKMAIKKEGKISTIQKEDKNTKVKKEKQETLAKKMKNTMNRAQLIGNDNVLVGQKNIAQNMDLELQAEDAEFEKLYECQQCGRSFKRDALEKHQKVCKKVFQLKRREFEVEEKRVVDEKQKLLAQKGKRKMEVDKNLKKGKGKKWKKQSEGLRQLIKKKGGKKKKDIEVEIVV